ncbi:MAG: hypothetical protein K2X66_05645 [Cyanobacteria bacterium]|nr:hypothetical protein [Cyanobacteriota bacterium]
MRRFDVPAFSIHMAWDGLAPSSVDTIQSQPHFPFGLVPSPVIPIVIKPYRELEFLPLSQRKL